MKISQLLFILIFVFFVNFEKSNFTFTIPDLPFSIPSDFKTVYYQYIPSVITVPIDAFGNYYQTWEASGVPNAFRWIRTFFFWINFPRLFNNEVAYGIDYITISLWRQAPRTTWYNMGSNTYNYNTNAPKQLPSLVKNSDAITQFSGHVDYAQGVLLYALIGICFLIVTIIWGALVCYYCFCCTLFGILNPCCFFSNLLHGCSPKCFKIFNFLNCCSKTCLRIFITFLIIITSICFGLYLIYFHQFQIGISQFGEDIVTYILSGSTIFDKAIFGAKNATVSSNSVVDSTMNILALFPNAETIANFTGCTNFIVSSLPNATNIKSYVNNLYTAIGAISTLSIVLTKVSNVETKVNSIRNVDINATQITINDQVSNIRNIQTSLSSIATTMQSFNQSIMNIPSTSYMFYAANKTETYFNANSGVLGSTNLNNLKSELPADPSIVVDKSKTAAGLDAVVLAINDLKSVNFSKVTETIDILSNYKSSLPSTYALEQAIININNSLNNITVTYIQDSIISLNTSINQLWVLKDDLINSINQAYNISSYSLPDTSILFNELAKINSTANNLGCVEYIKNYIININNTLIILSNSTSGIFDQINSLKSQLLNISFSSLTDKLNNINNTLQGNTTKINEQINGINNLQNSFNITSYLSQLTSSNVQIQNSKSNININDIYQKIRNINNTLFTTNFDLSTYKNNLTTIGIQINTINTIPISSLSTKLKIPAEPSDAEKTAARTAIDAVKGISSSSPTGMTTSINTFDSNIQNLPNINDFISSIVSTNSTLNSVDLSSTQTSIDSGKSKLSFDFQSVRDQIQSFNDSLKNSIPSQSSVISSIDSMTNQSSQISNLNIQSYFQPILDIYAQIDPVNTSVAAKNLLLKINSAMINITSIKDGLLLYKDFGLNFIRFVDSLRIIVVILILLVIFFIPFIACCSWWCCCKCCLSIVAKLAIVLMIFVCLPIIIFIPINIFLDDNCSIIEDRLINLLTVAFPNYYGLGFSYNLSTPIGAINPSLNVSLMLNTFISGDCTSGNDPISFCYNFANNLLNNFPNSTSLVSLFGLNNLSGFQIHPNLYGLFQKVLDQAKAILIELIDFLKTFINCPGAYSIYVWFKDMICKNLNYLLLSIWIFSFFTLIYLLIYSCCCSFFCGCMNFSYWDIFFCAGIGAIGTRRKTKKNKRRIKKSVEEEKKKSKKKLKKSKNPLEQERELPDVINSKEGITLKFQEYLNS